MFYLPKLSVSPTFLAMQPAPRNNVDVFLFVLPAGGIFYVGFSLYRVVFACMTVQLIISLNNWNGVSCNSMQICLEALLLVCMHVYVRMHDRFQLYVGTLHFL